MATTSHPKVSVVVPNYNHARFLPKRIESILGQTFQGFELILLDDCSTDDSRSILAKYADSSRVRKEFNEINSGSSFKQWNKGVRLARGEYVWIAESDDHADGRFLEKLVARLDAEPEAGFAYCRSWSVSFDDQPNGFADPAFVESDPRHRWTRDFCAEGLAECRSYLRLCNTVPNASAVVFRKAIYQQVGGADESLRLCSDWKLWVAMALTGKVVYLAEPLNYYRFHNATVRSVIYGSETELRESLPVRWWILDQATRSEWPISDPQLKRTLTNCCMEQAFRTYPDFPDISRLALQRVQELGGTDYMPPFGSWRGELLKRIIGWKATRRAHVFYHRSLKRARNAMGRGQTAD
jgi:glycosyltransferase involved in cell wall biosynthesis